MKTIHAVDKKRRNEDKALSRRDEADGGVDEVAESRRQMGERHPNKEKPAQSIELRTAFEAGEFHDSNGPGTPRR